MKKKFLGLATVLGLGLVINSTTVEAEESEYITTAEKNYSISIKADHSAGAELTMTLGGSDYAKSDDTAYYVYLSNDANTIPLDKVSVGAIGCEVNTNFNNLPSFKLVTNSGALAMSYDWYMLNNFNYAYVVKETTVHSDQGNHRYCEFSNKAIEVKQPALEAIGTRYQYYVFSKEKKLNVFPLFPYGGEIGSHKINTKIGLINNKDLLKKLAKKQSGSMNELLEYAKNAEGKTYTYADEESYDMDLQDFQVTNGAYYYIYSTYENTDGAYRDLSDVTIVMGEHGMLVSDVKWEADSDDSNGGIVNPKTGIQKPYLFAIVFALLAGACFICIRRIKIFSK